MKDIHFIYSNNKSQAGILYVKKDKRMTYWDKVATGELVSKDSLHNYLNKLENNGYQLETISVN